MRLNKHDQQRLDYLHKDLRRIHESEVDDDTDFDVWVEAQDNNPDAQDRATAAEFLELSRRADAKPYLAIKQHNVELARIWIQREGRGAYGDCLEDAETQVMAKLADTMYVDGMMLGGYYDIELISAEGIVLDGETLIL